MYFLCGMIRKENISYCYLSCLYDDGYSESLKLESSSAWFRFKRLSSFFLNNQWCGLVEVSIADNRNKIIMSIKNHFKL